MFRNLRGNFLTAVLALVVVFTYNTSYASTLSLNFAGTTSGATLNGSAIDDATVWSLSATFDSASVIREQQGVGSVTTSKVSGLLGNTAFTSSDVLTISLIDPNNQILNSFYYVGIGTTVLNILNPVFVSSTTTGWDAINPTPTVFFDNLGALGSSLSFNTSLGNLNLSIDPGAQSASITAAAVPEPSTYLLVSVGLVALGYARKKTHKSDRY
jgi:PEP-CTERM motif